MMKFIRGYGIAYGFATMSSVIAALLFVLFSTEIGKIVDAVSLSQEKLVQSILTAVCYLVLWNVSQLGFIYLKNQFVRDVLLNLKGKLYGKIVGQSIRSYATQSESSYLNDLSKNIDLLEEDWLNPMCELAAEVFSIVLSVGALLWLEWRLTAIFFVISLATVMCSQVPSLFIQKATNRFSNQSEQYLGVVSNHLKGFEQIKLLGLEALFRKKFAIINSGYEKSRFHYNITVEFSSTVTRLISFLSQIACMSAGAWFVWRGEFTVGGLIAAVQLLNGVFSPLQMAIQNVNVMKATKEIRAHFDRILQVTNEEGEAIQSVQQIEFQDISYQIENRKIFDNFSYVFKKGQHYAIIGKSGVGKSTLMKMLLQYFQQDTGTITINGMPVEQISSDNLLKKIAYVQKNDFLEPGNVLDNILLGRSLTLSTDMQAWFSIMNFDDVFLAKPAFDVTQLVSQGEKQRIDLLRFLVTLPQYEVIIFDEPTSHLDPKTASMVMRQIANMTDKIVIVITHQQDEALLATFDEVIPIGEV